MKRTVDVGARIRDHLDFANLELGTGRILCSRCLTTEPVTDDRGRESLIRDHTVLDSVTDIDQPFWHQLPADSQTRRGITLSSVWRRGNRLPWGRWFCFAHSAKRVSYWVERLTWTPSAAAGLP